MTNSGGYLCPHVRSLRLRNGSSLVHIGLVSRFRAGEWLADLLCLIPIHIAITQENRFVPLKDGVVSAQLEKSLLGAEVNKIVDSISLGWYESIFQILLGIKSGRVYFPNCPGECPSQYITYANPSPGEGVVSSMGEQSVGKSFTLNHLVDTSFSGSAMRTTGKFRVTIIWNSED